MIIPLFILAVLLPVSERNVRPTVSITWSRRYTEHPPLESDWCVEVDIDAGNEYRTIRYCPAVNPVQPLNLFLDCMLGPGVPPPAGCVPIFDGDGDGDVDLRDWANLIR